MMGTSSLMIFLRSFKIVLDSKQERVIFQFQMQCFPRQPSTVHSMHSTPTPHGKVLYQPHCPALGTSRLGVLDCPLLGRRNSSLLVLFPALGDVGSQRVVGVGSAEEGLDGEEDGSDLQSGRPVV